MKYKFAYFLERITFSTYDADYDNGGKICAESFKKGARRYNACLHSNLNGPFHSGSHNSFVDGVNYLSWKDSSHTLKIILMNVRAPE